MPIELPLEDAIERLVEGVRALHLDEPLAVGVHTGGVWVAERVCDALGLPAPAVLDASFYRDDLGRSGLPERVRPSTLPDLDGRAVLLVDDVLYTGRTVRAALGVLFDYGRPALVRLAALVDRGGRELPVCADAVGLRLEVPAHEQVKLHGPQPLRLVRGAAP